MGRTFDEVLGDFSEEDRREIMAETDRLEAEHLSLIALRKARDLTQVEMAKTLGMSQANVSEIERRADILLSTLGKFVAATGGRLRLSVEYPDAPPVRLTGFSDIESGEEAR